MTNNGLGLDSHSITGWVRQIVALREQGLKVVLVSSGAVAEGVVRLGLKERPKAIHTQQAAAAVGQMGLIQAYESRFQEYQIHTAQILLSREDLSNRKRYLNSRSTLCELLELGVIPVVNENDTVATAELCFGDNDTLAALVANLVNADALILLTDQNGLYDSDPRSNPKAELLTEAFANDQDLMKMTSGSSGFGRGGMITKVRAANLAARSGACTVIAHGSAEDILLQLRQGMQVGTLLLPEKEPIAARKQWLAGQLQCCGRLQLDPGAVRVLRESGRSLLPVGVTAIQEHFERGDVVGCIDENGVEIARGLVNYSSVEAAKIIGNSSDKIQQALGYAGDEEIIHRDNLVIL